MDSRILEPWTYVANVPGKNIRNTIIQSFNAWLQVPSERVTQVEGIVHDLHTASLLIDDIEDNSSLRRGVPVAHNVFGVPRTLNAANYVYFLALNKCKELGSAYALNVFIEEMMRLHHGQGEDILWRDTLQCPTEEQYLQMVKNKTGGLFRMAIGLLLDTKPPHWATVQELLDTLAMYFQIRDDYMNLCSQTYHDKKSFCEDLTEGKFSFPIIHGIQSDPNDNRLLSILKQRSEAVNIKQHAVDYLNERGSMEYTRDTLSTLYTKIEELIQELGGNNVLSKLLVFLHDGVNIKKI